jgi:hypothetical protein
MTLVGRKPQKEGSNLGSIRGHRSWQRAASFRTPFDALFPSMPLLKFKVENQKAIVLAEANEAPPVMSIAGPDGVWKSTLLFAAMSSSDKSVFLGQIYGSSVGLLFLRVVCFGVSDLEHLQGGNEPSLPIAG